VRFGFWKSADVNENAMPSDSELEQFVAFFARHGVEFLVIGGQAETLMGSPRVTYDTDICYRRSADNLTRLAAALKELKPTLRNAPADLPIVLDAEALALGSDYTFDTPIGQLDLLGWVEPVGTYEAMLPASEVYNVGSFEIRTIGLEDLIRIKQHIGRPKDRDSLFQLLAIRTIRNQMHGRDTDQNS
jgi:hypothetical protein